MGKNAMLDLLIARHGNTFDLGDTMLRVGNKTDLPLSQSGCEQARKLHSFLTNHHPRIDRVLVSHLQRTQQTAAIALPNNPLEMHAFLNEIDYGVDEGQPELAVMQRIGEQALRQWEEYALPPPGWRVNPNEIIQNWKHFSQSLAAQYQVSRTTTILVVTSNGIARFAPVILNAMSKQVPPPSLKMKTGAISSFRYTQEQGWQLVYWNFLPT